MAMHMLTPVFILTFHTLILGDLASNQERAGLSTLTTQKHFVCFSFSFFLWSLG